ncbi:MAG: pyridoxamine 5'-phosphate oxidase [Bacteroidales bacterium]|nr:pyridoxamine 5'-phosphate oxidase [Bacteroidales bacterium]
MKIHSMRQQYAKDSLDERTCPADPFIFFDQWFRQAVEQHAFEANACILSTANELRPSSRVVLLKEFSENGFVFFTNYDSRKANDLNSNPMASLLFFWPDLQRQVRVEGVVEKIPAAESDAYFSVRPVESQVSAIISPQSRIIPSKEWLIEQRDQFLREGKKTVRPNNWGGFALKPDYIEFWQGGQNRLHDRIVYEKTSDWTKKRLAP